MNGSIKDGVAIKSLQSRLEKEKAEISVLHKQMSELKGKQKQHQQRIDNIQGQLRELTKGELILSEHAKLRFLERIELIPTDEIEERVITEELKKMVGILGGTGEFPLGIGEHTCIIKGNIITTIK